VTGRRTLIGCLTDIHRFARSEARGGGALTSVPQDTPPDLRAQASGAKPSRHGLVKFRQRVSASGTFWVLKGASRIAIRADGNPSQARASLEGRGNAFPEAKRFIDAITRPRPGMGK
jgi:acyl-[acyl carrier protein]--UDP-N-acetylglucosamine O-acyltransferase